MADSLDNLLKSEDDSKQNTAKPSKKLNESKRRLSNICRSLTINSKIYSPQKTVNSVEAYIKETDKIDRILYSEISAFIVALDEEGRGIFSTNIDKLLLYVLDDSNDITDDARKIVIKVYDHFQLNLTQIESANNITERAIIGSLEEEKISLHKEIKGIEKEYITILGIFAAIMLAFVGSFTFSTSVLNNIAATNAYTVALIALVIGLVFVILITVLIDFLRDINDKYKDANGKRRINVVSKFAIIILAILIAITMLGSVLSKIKFPEKIYVDTPIESQSQIETSE